MGSEWVLGVVETCPGAVPGRRFFFRTFLYDIVLLGSEKIVQKKYDILEVKISYKKMKIFWVENNIDAKKEDIIYENIILTF